MRALVLGDRGLVFDADYQTPVPRPAEVLVRVLRAGICETDLQLVRGYMGFRGVPGHEFVGVAESGRFAGRRVVAEINCICGECRYCRSGLGNHCPKRSVLGILNHDGAFADYLAVPERNLHAVPDDLSDEIAVFVEPLAAALEITEQLAVGGNESVVVLGDGRLGNLSAQVLAARGCPVTAVGKHAEKLAVLERLGLNTLRRGDAQPDRSADVVVDCTGSASGLADALEWVRPRGTVVMKTTVAGEHTLSMAPLVIDEITLVGSRCGPFAKAIAALLRGEVNVAPLIAAVYPLEEGPRAFEAVRDVSFLKVQFDVAGTAN